MNDDTANRAREAVDAIYRTESRQVLATLSVLEMRHLIRRVSGTSVVRR